ncbi:MAG: four helix bundle suffix domain-containing protein [Paludibacteraceae bacterium]|nr:four helix bundle suffix domain-containing protein [Paludibacteraceae bacterium]
MLIKQADYLLFKQLKRLEKDFLKNDGFNERMYRLKSERRK